MASDSLSHRLSSAEVITRLVPLTQTDLEIAVSRSSVTGIIQIVKRTCFSALKQLTSEFMPLRH